MAKSEDNLTLDIINTSNYKNNNVEILLRLKLRLKKIVYTITLEKRKCLLSLTLTPALYNNFIISYYDISDFEHILQEIKSDYKIRSNHIKYNICCI